ncbi:hypothetical protein C8R46DRAFT_1357514 [Mycena filopes]|nr:hypothetical protein C8R46DRAFT_1357514 [Mycena filopes]
MNAFNTNTTSSVHSVTLGVAGLSLKKTNRLQFDDGVDARRDYKRHKDSHVAWPSPAPPTRVPHSSFRRFHRHHPRKFLPKIDRLPSSFDALYEACKMDLFLQDFDNLGLQPSGDDARELDTLIQGFDGLGLQPAGMDAVEEEQLCRGVDAMSLRKRDRDDLDDDGDVIMKDVKTIKKVKIASSIVARPACVSHPPIPTSHRPHSPALITAVPVAVPVAVPATFSPLQNRRTSTSLNGVKSRTKKIPGGVKRTTASGKENTLSSARKSSLARRPY